MTWNGSVLTDEDSAIQVNVPANDRDAEGGTLTASVVHGPTRGTLTANPKRRIRGTPAAWKFTLPAALSEPFSNQVQTL